MLQERNASEGANICEAGAHTATLIGVQHIRPKLSAADEEKDGWRKKTDTEELK